MEAKQTSVKWKRSSALTGISTRSKSQIHHDSLSVRARDCNGHPEFTSYQSNLKRPRSADLFRQDSLDGSSVLNNTLIKDLRVKRVFSPTPTPTENLTDHYKFVTEFGSHKQEICPKAAKNDGVESCGNEFSSSGPDIDDSESKVTEKSEMGIVVKAPKFADASLQSPVSEVIRGISFNVEQRSGGSNQECALKSPPDAKEDKTKMALNPRRRVFKAPSSFNYRRLLPHLKDIAKDNSCVLDFCERPNLDKGLEGKPFHGMRASETQAGSLHRFNAHRISRECHTSGSSPLLETLQVYSDETSNGNKQGSESPEYVPEFPCLTVVDECPSKPPVPLVDGQTENFDVGFSVQKLNVAPSSSSAAEDSQVNKDHVIDMYTDGNIPIEDVASSYKAGNGEAQNVEHMKPTWSPVMDECYSCKDNVNQSQNEGIGKTDTGHPCISQSPINEQRVTSGGLVLNQNQIDDSNEESVQMTPPDAEILGKLEVEVKRVSRAGYVLQTADKGLGKASNAFNHSDATCVDVKKQETNPKRKRVLNPCSRLKLFKSPGSVSYRRLLPYLMDLEKNNSCSNISKDFEHRLLPPLTPNQQETPMDQPNGLRFHSENQSCDPGTLPTPQLSSTNGSSNDNGDNHTSPEHVTESQMSSYLQKEQHVQEAVSGIQNKLETSPDIISSGYGKDPSVSLSCPSTCDVTSIKDAAVSVTNSVSDYPQEDYISSRTALSRGGKPVQADSLCQNLSQIDTTVSSGTHAVGPRIRILKRNPRGCRGLCNCLNCASFRLHAERAFEFSRNQMQDSEEVALDLMKELSNLRKMLEMSAVGANTHVMDLNEVKKACKKASEAEDCAKRRLDEMNHDLKIHCRITCLHGPRVTFANYVEEKVIPKENFSSN